MLWNAYNFADAYYRDANLDFNYIKFQEIH